MLTAGVEMAESPRILLRAFTLSLLNQTLPGLGIYCLAIPLARDIAWHWFAIIVPFVALVSLIPISIGDIGVREYLYVALFGAVGMPAQTTLALALSVLAAAIAFAVLGFVIFSFDHRSARHGAVG